MCSNEGETVGSVIERVPRREMSGGDDGKGDSSWGASLGIEKEC